MGVHLQLQVERLVLALRESTLRERQKVMEHLQNDCSRVRVDLSKTQDIHHYLASLLEETDPFLLIWVKCLLITLLPGTSMIREGV